MQHLSQSFRIKDPESKDLFLDIAAEELSHMEMAAQTISSVSYTHLWGISSAGRARGSQSRGQWFDPPILHHIAASILACRFFFCKTRLRVTSILYLL